MDYLEIKSSFPDHPKVIMLAESLKIDKDAAAGKLIRLWLWAIKNRSDGVIFPGDFATIAEVMRLKNKKNSLEKILKNNGLIDGAEGGPIVLHDWYEHAGKALLKQEKQRSQARDRMRKHRRSNARSNDPVTQMLRVTRARARVIILLRG